jgi:hypothetical protein
MKHRKITPEEYQRDLVDIFIHLLWILLFIIGVTSEAYGL